MIKTQIRTFSKDGILVQQRRNLIINEAMRVFSKNGYDRTNMTEIAEALGMTRGFLYHYLGSKEDILKMIINGTVENQRLGLEVSTSALESIDPAEALLLGIEKFILGIDQNSDGYIFINHVMVNLPSEYREYVFKSEKRVIVLFENILSRGKESGQFKVDDTFAIAHTILVLSAAWAHRRWMLGKRYTVKTYIKEVQKQIFQMTGYS